MPSAGTRGGCGATTRRTSGSRARRRSSTCPRRRSGRVPKKWQTELIDHVAWCRKNIRTKPAQSSVHSAPVIEKPCRKKPRTNGMSRLRPTKARKLRLIQRMPLSSQRSGGVLAKLGRALGLRQPADVREPQALEARALADVRAVRIALLVGVGVVLAVVGDPGDRGPLDGHRAEDRPRVLHGLARLEGLVGQHAVVADRDAEPGDDVHEGHNGQLDGPDSAVPEQHDGQQQGKERHDDRSKIGVALNR